MDEITKKKSAYGNFCNEICCPQRYLGLLPKKWLPKTYLFKYIHTKKDWMDVISSPVAVLRSTTEA